MAVIRRVMMIIVRVIVVMIIMLVWPLRWGDFAWLIFPIFYFLGAWPSGEGGFLLGLGLFGLGINPKPWFRWVVL